MRTRVRPVRLALAAGTALVLGLPLVAALPGHAAGSESLSVNLASTRGPSTGVGEGFLYGFTSDGTQPVDQFIQPLGINAFRGGGWFSGGWIKDDYQYGDATKADIASIVDQAKRLQNEFGPGFQYQVLLSDLYGANAGEPAGTQWPCANDDCSNYVTFLTTTINALE